MRVFKDVFTGDELCSDSYNQEAPMDDPELKDVRAEGWSLFFLSEDSIDYLLRACDDAGVCTVAFEVKTRRIVKGAEDYGIADNSEEDGGGVDAGSETVIDVVDAFRLQETPFSKKEFGVYIKGYMQRVKSFLEKEHPDRVDAFMSGGQALVKKILSNFDDFQFFLGESADCEAGVIFAYYKDGEEAPRLIYIRDGLKEEKY